MSDVETPGSAAVPSPDTAPLTGASAVPPAGPAAPLGASHPAVADERPIDLLAYVKRLGRFLLPGAIVGLVVAAVVALTSGGATSATTYNTKAHLMLQPSTATVATSVSQAQLVGNYLRTFVALGDADVITNDVSQAMGGKYSPTDVANDMKVYWGGGSLLLAVQVSAPNHADALAMANAGAKALVAHQADLIKMSGATAPKLVLVQSAIDQDPATTGGTASSLMSRLLPAVAAGVVVALVAAILLEWLNSRRRQRVAAPTASTRS